MIKRNFIIIMTVLVALGLESCSDWLNTKPESEIVLDDYWQSEAQAQAVLTACYRGLTTEANMQRMIVWGELRSDNMTFGSVFPTERLHMGKILDVNIVPTNAYCSWASMYSVINNCNTFLYYAPNVLNADQNFTAGKLHAYEAEVLTIRALCYFYLLRTFHEVPWIDTPSIDDIQNYKVAKNTEREVLDHLIADLKIALTNARIDFGTEELNKGHITKNAVRALLADVYLWDQQYDNSVEMCNQIINEPNTKLKLVAPEMMYINVFYRGNSTESIFELQFDENVQKNLTTYNLYGTASDVQGELSFPLYLVKGEYSPFKYKIGTEVESEKDLRFKDYVVQNLGDLTGIYSIFKYAGIQRSENSQEISTYSWRSTTPNWIVYRLADILLMKAEALTALPAPTDDQLKEALALVNRTYQRSNATSAALDFTLYNTKGIMEKLILRERQRELMFEGKRWFDLLRLARRYNSPTALLTYLPNLTGLQFSKLSEMNALYMPVPQADIDINYPILVQNPFYDETITSNK
ncbi:MAG: RagB/SusD family nutrient uptake outer membrane protein [Paludibacter sp.]